MELSTTTSKRWRPIVGLLLLGAALGLIVLFGTGYMVHATGTNAFCVSCHSMDITGKEYRASSHHSNRSGVQAGCSDCHLPHEYPQKLVQKAISGIKDVYGELTGVINTQEKYEARRLAMAEHEWARLKSRDSAECRSCHSKPGLTAAVQSDYATRAHARATAEGKTCIDCHKGLAHREPERTLAATASKPAECTTCHKDIGTVLPAGHKEVKTAGIAGCLECHEPGETAAREKNPLFVALHKGHAMARVGCDTCHVWSADGNFGLPGYEQMRRGLTADSLQRVQTSTVAWAKQPYLSNAHGSKAGLACAACHGAKLVPSDSEAELNQGCRDCHGTAAKLAAAGGEHVNPHKSHLGDINCTACHAAHAPSKAYCSNCHAFAMNIPAGRVAPAHAAPALGAPASATVPAATQRFDVVVIGAGGAGFTAAISAHDAGAKVVLIEKQPITGGNSMLAAGGMNAAETRFQKARGIKDSVALMAEDTMKGGQNRNEPALVQILARNSAGSVEWLTRLGADLSDVGRMGGASVNRTHRPTGGSAVGAHIIEVLRKNAAQRKIDVRVNSKVVKILEDASGTVTGVVVQGKHGTAYTIEAKAVILTSGGFSANPERVAKYRPEFAGMTTSNQPGATGDGLDLAAAIGGELKDMDQIQIHPTVAAGSRILITEAVRGNGAILVNHEGKRFVNELTTRDKASAAILQQKGKSAFLVFDDGVRKSLKQIDGYFHLELVKQGATVAELAKAINVPAEALQQTLSTYNQAVEQKKDAAFERPDMPRPIKTASFFAIEIKPGVHYTMGGVRINEQAQVLDKDGKPIARFYAAGEATGGVHGSNRLGGNSISETITFGRIAGENAARAVRTRAGAQGASIDSRNDLRASLGDATGIPNPAQELRAAGWLSR